MVLRELWCYLKSSEVLVFWVLLNSLGFNWDANLFGGLGWLDFSIRKSQFVAFNTIFWVCACAYFMCA